MATWDTTRGRVETYFDQTATATWEALTSTAPVSRVRRTVRAGRDAMRAEMLGRLPADLTGQRVLDAGCGAGQMVNELAARGATVVGVDISPSLLKIAAERLPAPRKGQVMFQAGDMTDPALGRFDHVIAMDSLLYYTAADIGRVVAGLSERTRGSVVFTVAPRTAFLMAFFWAGKAFPRSDRSPVMIPHAAPALARAIDAAGGTGTLRTARRIASGFYISQCLEYRR